MTQPRLTTVAAFDLPAKAEFAKIVLADAGIPAVVTDAQIVAMDWLLSNAVGGIKVQVRVEDAERAVAVLADKTGPDGRPRDGGISDDELARQALEAGEASDMDEEPAEAPPERPFGTVAPMPHVPAVTGDPGRRDRDARRAFVMGWLGIGCPPLSAVGLFFLLCAAFGAGPPLTSRGRFNLFVAALLVGTAMLVTIGLWYGIETTR